MQPRLPPQPNASAINEGLALLIVAADPDKYRHMLEALKAKLEASDAAEREAKAARDEASASLAAARSERAELGRREADLALREKDLASERAAVVADLKEIHDFQKRVRTLQSELDARATAPGAKPGMCLGSG